MRTRRKRAQSSAAFMATLVKAWAEMEDSRGLTCHSLVYQAFQRWLSRNPPKRAVKAADMIMRAFYAGYAEGEDQAKLVASAREAMRDPKTGMPRDLIALGLLPRHGPATSSPPVTHKGHWSHEPSPLITHMKAMARS